jgi:hypothetical protein
MSVQKSGPDSPSLRPALVGLGLIANFSVAPYTLTEWNRGRLLRDPFPIGKLANSPGANANRLSPLMLTQKNYGVIWDDRPEWRFYADDTLEMMIWLTNIIAKEKLATTAQCSPYLRDISGRASAQQTVSMIS